jgi:predicted AlkP superfamily phosphohydrolase/phosphomutase
LTEVLVFGVDGLNPEAVRSFAGEGFMPEFNELMQRSGCWSGELESFVCEGYDFPHTGPMWTSLYTGLRPKEHGLQSGGWDDGDSEFHRMRTVFDVVGEETSRDMVLWSMPMTYRAKEIPGTSMLSGFVSPSLKSLWSKLVHPDELADDLGKDFMECTASYVANVKTDGAHRGEDSEEFLRTMKEAENRRLRGLTRRFGSDTDVVCFGTTVADKMGHVNGIRVDGGMTREVYSFVDNLLGRLRNCFEPEEVVVVSDHGFSGYSHDLEGFGLDTSGREFGSVFDFAPTFLDHFGLDYEGFELGPEDSSSDLTADERREVKDQLHGMGYF